MVEVSRSGAVRSMISWRNVQQNTARNARIIDDTVVCRTCSYCATDLEVTDWNPWASPRATSPGEHSQPY